MPVISVNYDVRKDRQKNEESLIIEITTNGSLSPELALSQASAKLVSWFLKLTGTQNLIQPEKKLVIPIKQKETILIEELQLSVRAYNCLKRANVHTLSDLLQDSADDLLEFKNFGQKSADEVCDNLKKRFDLDLRK